MLFIWLVIALILLLSLTGFFLGAPYLPTLGKQVNAIFSLAEMKRGQTLIELGCGDGRVLVEAAKRGINSVGYEINPILFIIALLRSKKYKGRIKVVCGNYWQKEWPKADVIFVFLIGRYMGKLDKYVKLYPHKPVKLVSFAFKLPDRQISKQQENLYLYEYK
jgi:16S rRNA A1518/A1519 N6-dimethyltransferase RsmA/KsgA/DIM1 with predicted DNA glycosylase/AP lyase activity